MLRLPLPVVVQGGLRRVLHVIAQVTETTSTDVICKARNDAVLGGLLTVFHTERSTSGLTNVQNELPVRFFWRHIICVSCQTAAPGSAVSWSGQQQMLPRIQLAIWIDKTASMTAPCRCCTTWTNGCSRRWRRTTK